MQIKMISKHQNSKQVMAFLKKGYIISNYLSSITIIDKDDLDEIARCSFKVFNRIFSKGLIEKFADGEGIWHEGYFKLSNPKE